MQDSYMPTEHPSPQRENVTLALVFFGLFAGPVAWGLQLVVNYALASYPCFPGDTPRTIVAPNWHIAWAVVFALNILAALCALAGAAVSYRHWQAVRTEHHGSAEHALEAGEGRTRFLALWGVMTGGGFLIAILLNTLALFVVPQCVG